jgi:hypothetical protein
MRKVLFGVLVAGWVVAGALGGDVSPAAAIAVPLPSTLPLLGLGLALLGASRRRSK